MMPRSATVSINRVDRCDVGPIVRQFITRDLLLLTVNPAVYDGSFAVSRPLLGSKALVPTAAM